MLAEIDKYLQSMGWTVSSLQFDGLHVEHRSTDRYNPETGKWAEIEEAISGAEQAVKEALGYEVKLKEKELYHHTPTVETDDADAQEQQQQQQTAEDTSDAETIVGNDNDAGPSGSAADAAPTAPAAPLQLSGTAVKRKRCDANSGEEQSHPPGLATQDVAAAARQLEEALVADPVNEGMAGEALTALEGIDMTNAKILSTGFTRIKTLHTYISPHRHILFMSYTNRCRQARERQSPARGAA